MRIITQHSTYIYKSKSSAMRAARNAVGHQYLVEAPELGSRFDGVIPVTKEMISVEPLGDGWRWSYTFYLSDVLVRVRHADGNVADVRYGEVAHWKDATTPGDPIVQAQAAEFESAKCAPPRECATCAHGEYGGATDCEPCRQCTESTLSSWTPSVIPRCETCARYRDDYSDDCDVCQDEDDLPGWKPSHHAFVLTR